MRTLYTIHLGVFMAYNNKQLKQIQVIYYQGCKENGGKYGLSVFDKIILFCWMII